MNARDFLKETIGGQTTGVNSLVRWFVRCFVGSLVGSFAGSLVRSFACLFVRSFDGSLVRSFVGPTPASWPLSSQPRLRLLRQENQGAGAGANQKIAHALGRRPTSQVGGVGSTGKFFRFVSCVRTRGLYV